MIHASVSHPQKEYFGNFSLSGINIKVKELDKDAFPVSPDTVPSYFWLKGQGQTQEHCTFPLHKGYLEVRQLIGEGTVEKVQDLSRQALDYVTQIFQSIEDEPQTIPEKAETLPIPSSKPMLVWLRLSSDLQKWRDAQHAIGNVLPPKGPGLTRAPEAVLNMLNARDWPAALQTNNVLFGNGIANFLIGGADESTMFSNLVIDMTSYYEHGYKSKFPSLERLIKKGLLDSHALSTLGGFERRSAVHAVIPYVEGKIALEKRYQSQLKHRSARLGRRAALIVNLFDNSIVGMGTEAIARGFDPAAAASDLIFATPGTDVVDVGCDLLNSEVMNTFLNVTDITDTGIVSEDVLRRIFDAYAAISARMLTERWHEPVARMCASLYIWHILNDRHMFWRRAILGWPKVRRNPARPQREADFDEVFDMEYRTTGFSRPLDPKYECNGQETCDHVSDFFRRNDEKPLLRDLWWILVTRPLEYVRSGTVDEQTEQMLVEGAKYRIYELYTHGLVFEMLWLIAHASHHAWQVNYLNEAAMFGSILDGGKLAGKLDRYDSE